VRYYTNSEMQTFKDCRRKWWLGSYRHLRTRRAAALGAAPIGTRVHKGLEAWYQPDGQPRTDPRAAVRTFIELERARLIESYGTDEERSAFEYDPLAAALATFEKEAELATIMVDGYWDWLEEEGVDSDYDVLASESSVEYEFAPGRSLAGRRDTRVRRLSDGVKLSMDHKTGDFGDLEKQAQQNEQMLLYEILQRVTDPENRNEGMVLNMLRKVKRSAQAKPPFFKRFEIRFNQHQLDSAWYRFMAVINDIDAVSARLDAGESHLTAAYPRPNRDCSWKCEFYPVCPMFDDGSRVEDAIMSLYVVGDPLDRYPDLNGGINE
jgi:hypothetical protein